MFSNLELSMLICLSILYLHLMALNRNVKVLKWAFPASDARGRSEAILRHKFVYNSRKKVVLLKLIFRYCSE